MEEAGANAFEVETVTTPVASLDEVNRSKLVKSPKLKASQTRTGMMSTFMVNVVLLD